MTPVEEAFLADVRAVDWDGWTRSPPGEPPPLGPRAPWDDPVVAFEKIVERPETVDRWIGPFGNDHGGYIYPVALPAAGLLARATRELTGRSALAAYFVMEDLLWFCHAETLYVTPDGQVVRAGTVCLAAGEQVLPELARNGRSYEALGGLRDPDVEDWPLVDPFFGPRDPERFENVW